MKDLVIANKTFKVEQVGGAYLLTGKRGAQYGVMPYVNNTTGCLYYVCKINSRLSEPFPGLQLRVEAGELVIHRQPTRG